MELFYCKNIEEGLCRLDPEESGHCVKVLRHRTGDRISVIDGEGTFYDCTLLDASPKAAVAQVEAVQKCWGAHSYVLTMAVCPTKNLDRYEWFAEKATELGVDTIAPVIGEHSERKVLKTERLGKILLSATKQSLKGAVPVIREAVSVIDFIKEYSSSDALKMIAYCFEDDDHPRRSIVEVLREAAGDSRIADGGRKPNDESKEASCKSIIDGEREIVILIGPEGDFSSGEAAAALAAGFIPVHLGASRLRTETAALAAVSAVYFTTL